MLKRESEIALEKVFSKMKRKIYYDSNSIMEITGISERTLRYRLSVLSKKYENVPAMLYLKNREWRIHNAIVEEFLPKYKTKTNHLVNRDWKSFITWTPRDNYCKDYHSTLVGNVMSHFPVEDFPTEKFFPVLEKTKSGVHHVHMLSVYPVSEIEVVVKNVLNHVLLDQDCRLEVNPVWGKVQAVNYLFKDRESWKN